MKLNNKLVSFITGGASGLGLATVKHLSTFGVKIAAVDFNEKGISEA